MPAQYVVVLPLSDTSCSPLKTAENIVSQTAPPGSL